MIWCCCKSTHCFCTTPTLLWICSDKSHEDMRVTSPMYVKTQLCTSWSHQDAHGEPVRLVIDLIGCEVFGGISLACHVTQWVLERQSFRMSSWQTLMETNGFKKIRSDKSFPEELFMRCALEDFLFVWPLHCNKCVFLYTFWWFGLHFLLSGGKKSIIAALTNAQRAPWHISPLSNGFLRSLDLGF